MSETSPAEILSRLIQFNTVSRFSNLELIAWIEEYLAKYGVHGKRLYDVTGEKANLIATIGDASKPGFILSGHVDVVPVEGQDWSFDPFGGEIRDGRVLGRGSTDMKGYVACMLAAVPKMVAAPLAFPIHLVFSFDEEVGCKGIPLVIDEIASWETLPIGCFVGEPTTMEVTIGHKAKRSERATIRGATSHSSIAPTAVNALEYAARLAIYIADMGRDFSQNGPFDPLFDIQHTTANFAVNLPRKLVNVNTVPDIEHLDFEFRAIPENSPHDLIDKVKDYARSVLEPQMKAVNPDTGITFEELSDSPGVNTPVDHDLSILAKKFTRKNGHTKVAFNTEGGYYQEIGIPTLILGPGDIQRAHKPDEFIKISELAQCADFLSRLVGYCQGEAA